MYPDWCIYYNGFPSKRCDVGNLYCEQARPLTQDEIDWHNENYRSMSMETTAMSKRIPCCQENDVYCSDFMLPTPEDFAEYEKKINAFVKRTLKHIMIVRPLIEEDIEKKAAKKRTIQGIIACPICETGKVNYKYAGSYNGHIHAQCSTKDCVQWIE